jgi:tetratricopeptide (TPR) repeat protein
MNKAIIIYETKGRFSSAGDIKKKFAEELEKSGDYAQAIEEYKSAADYYEKEKSGTKSYYQTCKIKIADLMCISNHEKAYQEAKEVKLKNRIKISNFSFFYIFYKIYEEIGKEYLNSTLLRMGTKNLFFKCVIVILAYDVKYIMKIKNEILINILKNFNCYIENYF